MAEETDVDVLSDEERARLLLAAAEDERAGRMVRCETPDEVRKLVRDQTSSG